MPTLAPKGRLAEIPLPVLLEQLYEQRLTGRVLVECDGATNTIFFRDGYPVAVQLPSSVEQLGRVLYEMKFLDEATYRDSLTEPPPRGKRYGELLVQKNLISNDNLRLGLKAQVRRKLHRLFFLVDGAYSIEPGNHNEGVHNSEATRVHPARAIYQGVRSAWNTERLQRALAEFSDRAMWCSLTEETALKRYALAPQDEAIGELLRKGYWRYDDLAAAVSSTTPQTLLALVYALWVTNGLDVQPPELVVCLNKELAARLPEGSRPRTPTPARVAAARRARS